LIADPFKTQPAVHVLICDDNASIRALLRTVIESRPGLTVVGEATDGDEAIVEAERLQPNVILLDLAMPRKTGLEALQEITRVAPEAKVIVFSGFSMASVGHELLALGAVSYLQKGASPDAITDAIEQAAAHTAPIPLVTARPPAPAT
jgi:DNA-binding NarL/FixJ family response regulator